APVLLVVGELDPCPLARVLDDRLGDVVRDHRPAGALEPDRFVELDGCVEVGDVDAELTEPRSHGFNPSCSWDAGGRSSTRPAPGSARPSCRTVRSSRTGCA